MIRLQLTCVSLLAISCTTFAQNLLTNPNFSDGNTGFQTGYTYFTGSPLPAGRYTIAHTPQEHHPLQANFGDHTTGNGLMMVVNGGTLSNVYDWPVWQETVGVTTGWQYTFTGWTTTADSFDGSPAKLAARINGQTVMASFTVPQIGANWQQFSFTWSAVGTTNATISLFSLNTAAAGNDFVLDDLSFSPVPEPSTLWAMGLGAVGLGLSRRRHKR